MLSHERSKAVVRDPETGKLVGSLVRISEEARKSGGQNSSTCLGFSDGEIFRKNLHSISQATRQQQIRWLHRLYYWQRHHEPKNG